MQAPGEFGFEETVDEPVTRDPAQAGEFRRYDLDPVMGLAAGRSMARPVARMSGMAVRFIEDVQPVRLETLGQAFDDSFLHGHRGGSPDLSTLPLHSAYRRCRRKIEAPIPAGRRFATAKACPPAPRRLKVGPMDSNSPLFDRIRVKPRA